MRTHWYPPLMSKTPEEAWEAARQKFIEEYGSKSVHIPIATDGAGMPQFSIFLLRDFLEKEERKG